jgi:outer membrane protein OmpA-like peptidoglycan-associated protein
MAIQSYNNPTPLKSVFIALVLQFISLNAASQNISNADSENAKPKAYLTPTADSSVRCICKIVSLPFINFRPGSSKLTESAISNLEDAAKKLQGNPCCAVKFMVTSFTNKKRMRLQNKRLRAVIKYLISRQKVPKNQINPVAENWTDHESFFDLIPVPLTDIKR